MQQNLAVNLAVDAAINIAAFRENSTGSHLQGSMYVEKLAAAFSVAGQGCSQH
jgi:hypothetical protein